MRHELYADSRDVTKWSVCVQLAHEFDLGRILQVAMLTKEKGRGEGLHHVDAHTSEPVVTKFFEAERKQLAQLPGNQRLERVKALGPLLSPPVEIAVFGRALKDRGYYFDDLTQTLSAATQPTLVFLDPDTGFAPPLSERHVDQTEVRRVFMAMPLSSVVAAFQYNRRESASSCLSFAAAALSSALTGLTFSMVANTYEHPVAIVAARKAS